MRIDGYIFNDEGNLLQDEYIQDLFFEFLEDNGLLFGGIIFDEEDGEDID